MINLIKLGSVVITSDVKTAVKEAASHVRQYPESSVYFFELEMQSLDVNKGQLRNYVNKESLKHSLFEAINPSEYDLYLWYVHE